MTSKSVYYRNMAGIFGAFAIPALMASILMSTFQIGVVFPDAFKYMGLALSIAAVICLAISGITIKKSTEPKSQKEKRTYDHIFFRAADYTLGITVVMILACFLPNWGEHEVRSFFMGALLIGLVSCILRVVDFIVGFAKSKRLL